MRDNLPILLVAAMLPFLLAGCIIGDVTHTLYLSPDGAITWSVLERNMRSDDEDRAAAREEERAFIRRAHGGAHPVAEALDALRPDTLATRVLRGRRPFSVLTEAGYRSVADLAWEILRHTGARGDARLEVDGDRMRFVLAVDVEQDDGAEKEKGDVLDPLIAELEEYRIRLTSGSFVEAAGFDLQEDGTVAVPLETSELDEVDGQWIYMLAWSLG